MCVIIRHGLLCTEDGTKTVIRFVCNKSIPLGEPRFIKEEDSTYYFDFETSLACEPRPLECRAFDSEGGEYDLSPLTKTENWVVVDTRPEHADLRYYINVCAPLNPIPGIHCPGR